MKAAFLDRDGTIVREYPDEQWAHIWEPELLEGAIEGLQVFQAMGYKLFVITNQPLINEGIISQAQYETFTTKMISVLAANDIAILKIKYCPHARWEGCSCLKPKTGMVDAICAEHPDLELKESFLAGDSDSDIELAQKLGVPSFKIDPQVQRPNSSVVRSLRDIPPFLEI